MKAIEHDGFTPKSDLGMRVWDQMVKKAVERFRAGGRMLVWITQRDPNFAERHLLDENLGAEIRRSSW